jgi:hypothetical protein
MTERQPNTNRHYAKAWQYWTQWCSDNGVDTMQPEVDAVGCYVLDLAAQYSPSQVGVHLAAIVDHHLAAGAEFSPAQAKSVRALFRQTWLGYQRPNVKLELRAADYRRLLAACDADDSLRGKRDGAVIALHWVGCFRATEISELDTAHIVEATSGLIKFRYDDRYIAIKDEPPSYAVSRLLEWLKAAGIVSGRLFRRIHKAGAVQGERLTDQAVRMMILKYRITEIGMNAERYSGQSVRKGRITDSYRRGVPFDRLTTMARLHSADATMSNVSRDALR